MTLDINIENYVPLLKLCIFSLLSHKRDERSKNFLGFNVRLMFSSQTIPRYSKILICIILPPPLVMLIKHIKVIQHVVDVHRCNIMSEQFMKLLNNAFQLLQRIKDIIQNFIKKDELLQKNFPFVCLPVQVLFSQKWHLGLSVSTLKTVDQV